MIITSGESQRAKEFVRQYLMDYDSNRDVATFMQIVVSNSKENLQAADAEFLEKRQWLIPAEGHVFACALDANGNQLGRTEFDLDAKDAAQEASNFIHRHAVARLDAEEKWKAAFAEAKRTNRRVWARVSQRYCGPCFSLARWLDDNRMLLSKDYVMIKIDDVLDQNGVKVAKRLTADESYGIPFYAIYDQNEIKMIDSAGPLGNIGFPSDFDGKKHLRKMLFATKQNLTNGEIDQLLNTLSAH